MTLEPEKTENRLYCQLWSRELGAPAQRPGQRQGQTHSGQPVLSLRPRSGDTCPQPMAEAVCFAPSDKRGPWSAGPGALGPLSGTCPCFHNMGGRRPWGPSARGAWGPAGVLSPGGWFQVADCPPHTLRRLLQGHRGDVRPAGLGLRASKAPRSKARLQAGHATRPTDVRPLGPEG